eukprot:CAMPEP_0169185070 /NCGR_PEP_ID=MMETSP1016-20121227/1581_1 /TAXON_ID=342587 /ORGANISM="Karlodinium micrum, Strain CCMP2283" /LENGTH=93 /DNA_ID=CAMNT_0009260711 /DNA_START=381 /DNA_END=662 /DNA_ORIENTATION=-
MSAPPGELGSGCPSNFFELNIGEGITLPFGALANGEAAARAAAALVINWLASLRGTLATWLTPCVDTGLGRSSAARHSQRACASRDTSMLLLT